NAELSFGKKALKWLDNFWYHYKWPTIIAAFFITVFAICTVQMVTREEYDMYVRYVGNAVITETQYKDIENSLEKMGFDANGDGESAANFAQVPYVSDDENPYKNEINADARQTLTAMIVQPYYIYIMDEGAYKTFKGENVFTPLNQIFSGDVSDIAYDDCAIYLKETEFCKNSPGMEWVKDGTVIVLKVAPYRSTISNSKYQSEIEAFEEHKKIFLEIVGK
ncbi:MAG: hypothetical protein IJW21_09145, partial [Clostridia bacterium]|nr:hypothetical protein [Clostridia bacterium]